MAVEIIAADKKSKCLQKTTQTGVRWIKRNICVLQLHDLSTDACCKGSAESRFQLLAGQDAENLRINIRQFLSFRRTIVFKTVFNEKSSGFPEDF